MQEIILFSPSLANGVYYRSCLLQWLFFMVAVITLFGRYCSVGVFCSVTVYYRADHRAFKAKAPKNAKAKRANTKAQTAVLVLFTTALSTSSS